jgi:hypothetical protein
MDSLGVQESAVDAMNSVLILSDVLDVEATAAAAIIEEFLKASVETMGYHLHLLADKPDDDTIQTRIAESLCVIFVLTKDSLQQNFIRWVHAAYEMELPIVPVSTTSFDSFPTEAFYTHRLPRLISEPQVYEVSLRVFFQQIACALNVAGSRSSIRTDVGRIAERIEARGDAMKESLAVRRNQPAVFLNMCRSRTSSKELPSAVDTEKPILRLEGRGFSL